MYLEIILSGDRCIWRWRSLGSAEVAFGAGLSGRVQQVQRSALTPVVCPCRPSVPPWPCVSISFSSPSLSLCLSFAPHQPPLLSLSCSLPLSFPPCLLPVRPVRWSPTHSRYTLSPTRKARGRLARAPARAVGHAYVCCVYVHVHVCVCKCVCLPLSRALSHRGSRTRRASYP